MEWLQRIYILILTPFTGTSNRLNPKFKNAAIYCICFLLYGTCYVWYSSIAMGITPTLISRMLFSIAMIALLIFFGLERNLKPVEWNKIVIYIWFLLGLLIFVMGFVNKQNLGYWMTGPVIAFGLPCFYMIYGTKEKYEVILDAISKAAIIISVLYFIFCLYGEWIYDNVWALNGQYNGVTTDANKIGELCLASFCCAVYYLITGKSKAWKVFSVIALGILIGQTYLTQSRTTMLAMALIIAFYIIILVKDIITAKDMKKILTIIIAGLLVVALAVGSIYITKQVHNKYLLENAMEEIDSSDITSSTDESQATAKRQIVPDKNGDFNSYSSGRLHIWETYAKGFNLIGNPADAEAPISPELAHRTAHNSFVEITYRSGYITGFVYLLLELVTGIFILMIMVRKNEKNACGDYYMAITSIAYTIFTNLMPSYNPLTAIIFLIYVLGMPVLLNVNKRVIRTT